jgi:hypothetical protein
LQTSAGWVVGLLMHWRSALASQHPLSARSCRLSFTGVGIATFFLKTKNTRTVLALPFAKSFLLPGRSRRPAGFFHAQPLSCIS